MKRRLGKIQKEWVKALEAHPERQMKEALGQGSPKDYKACCLGELLLVECRLKKKKLPFYDGTIMDKSEYGVSVSELQETYSKFGLRTESGRFTEAIVHNGERFWSLVSLNDSGASWTDIAKIIKKNPEKIFTKSV